MQLPVVKLPPGFIVYSGPSMIDGKPIVAIATGFNGNENAKTGDMIQIWIVRADMRPTEAYKTGEDQSVCGDCKHRKWGTCYVNVFQGPYSVHNAFLNNKYPVLPSAQVFAGRKVRLGAYGDPAAVPFYVLKRICDASNGHTGYTHQWHKCDARYRSLIMASCDTPEEFKNARRKGWRTFRIRLEGEPLLAKEFVCPASNEAGKRMTCARCMACDGGKFAGKGTPVIVAHGGGMQNFKRKYFENITKARRSKRAYRHFMPDHRLALV